MMKYTWFLLFAFITFNQNVLAEEYTDLIAYRDALREQIAAVDSEIERCEKSMKGWKAATIVGGIGTLASGVGLIIQNKKLKENKQELKDLSKDVKEANAITDFVQKVKQ